MAKAQFQKRNLLIYFSGESENGKQRTYRNISGRATADQLMQFANALEPITDNGGSPIAVSTVDTSTLDPTAK